MPATPPAAVQAISGYTTGYIFTGPAFNATTYNSTLPIVGQETAAPGTLLCNSGAWSGWVCNVDVDGWPSELHGILAMVPVHQLWGGEVGGPGDSGAPVFQLTSNSTAAIAVGMMDAINPQYEVPCQANNDGRLCASHGYYVDLPSLLAAFKGVGQGGLALNLG